MPEVREVEVDALECDGDGNVRIVRLAVTDGEGRTTIYCVSVDAVLTARVEER